MNSPCESESSLDGGVMLPPSPPGSREQLQKRIESLTQQNRVLKMEMETYKIRVRVLQEENRDLRQASVIIQAKAEQEEEYISNTLLKKIQVLKKEKETLAHQYEREEECLTNDLSRKLDQLRQEKCKLEQTLEQEQECLVNKLMRKIEKLEAETLAKQTNLEQLRREKIELENTLEQEQEALVNKLWKRMDKLEAEKRSLQIKLDQPVSDPTSPKYDDVLTNINGPDTASNLSNHIQTLRSEILRLRSNLAIAQKETSEKTQQFAADEKSIREENIRLQRKLQMEVERREALCRHLSESESSLEMEEERLYNESLHGFGGAGGNMNSSTTSLGSNPTRQRTISSPIPHSPSNSRPISPGAVNFPPRCCTCGQILNSSSAHLSTVFFRPITSAPISGRRTSERFIKPAIPATGLNTSAPTINPVTSFGNNMNSGASGILAGTLSLTAMGSGRSNSDNSSSSSSMTSSNNSMTSAGAGTQPPPPLATNANNGGMAGNSSNSNNNTTSSNSPGTPIQNLHTFIQPSSPMDTSVYKE